MPDKTPKISEVTLNINGESAQAFFFAPDREETISVTIKMTNGSEVLVGSEGVTVNTPGQDKMHFTHHRGVTVNQTIKTGRDGYMAGGDMNVTVRNARGVQFGPNNMQANTFFD